MTYKRLTEDDLDRMAGEVRDIPDLARLVDDVRRLRAQAAREAEGLWVRLLQIQRHDT